jgi:hypothetical protein
MLTDPAWQAGRQAGVLCHPVATDDDDSED